MSREMIHKHEPVFLKKYFESDNASAIFSAALRAIKTRYGYKIGDNGEHELLINLMDYVYHKVYKENPKLNVLQLNQHTIKMYVSIIEDKLQQKQYENQPDRPQHLSVSPSQDEFRNKIDEKTRERSNIEINDKSDLHKAFEQQLEIRKPKENDKTTHNFQIEQPELPSIDSIYEKEIKQRQISLEKPLETPMEKNTDSYTNAFTHYHEQEFIHAQPINSLNERIKQIQENQFNNTQNDTDISTENASILQTFPEPLQKFREEQENKITEEHIIVIDSRDRNYDDYLYSNNYRFIFNSPYDNVVSISLLSAEVPKSQYLINNSNQKIYFQETNAQVSDGIFLEANVAIGDYTLSQLKSAVENAMNAVGTANYTVDTQILQPQNKISIISDLSGGVNLFNLSFNGGTETFSNKTRSIYRPNSIGPVLGFSRKDFIGSSSYDGDQRINLNGDSYILLRFRDLPYMDAGLNSDGIQDAFAKIPLNVHTDNVKYHKEGDYQLIRTFEQVLTRLDHLDVSFVNYDGSLYDFNGLENSITLKITTLTYQSNA